MPYDSTFTTVDLFAGIGGIRLGFEKAGFQTVFANDVDPFCKLVYDANFKDAQLRTDNIQNIKSADIPNFDILLAGFPCQPFSIAGYRKGFFDERNGHLFFEIARILEDKQPLGFMLENVKNLQAHDNGKTFQTIVNTLNKIGYHCKTQVLNSMEYGNVPQNRERVYIVGFKDKATLDVFQFPEAMPLTKNIEDILENRVDKKYNYKGHLYYKKLKQRVKSHNTVYQWRRTYVRQNKSGVCPTLTANMGMGGHNVPIVLQKNNIRKLTPRECARIQGFSDSYTLPTNIAETKLYKQIGNSVTISVVERIANQIIKSLQVQNVYRKTNSRAKRELHAVA